MSALTACVATRGEVILLGAPHDAMAVNVVPLIKKSITLSAWYSGAAADAEDCLSFAQQHNIKPIVEVFPFDKSNEAYDKLKNNQMRFRGVLDMKKYKLTHLQLTGRTA